MNDQEISEKKENNHSKKKKIAWAGFFSGILVLLIVVSRTGLETISEAISQGGFALLLLAFIYPVELLPRTIAWKLVYPGLLFPIKKYFVLIMWYGQSINRLLPTATIGGDVVRGRMLFLKGEGKTDVVSSLIADKTSHALSILVLLIIGILLIAFRIQDLKIILGLAVSALILAIGIFYFIKIQKSSGVSKFVRKWGGNKNGLLSDTPEAIEKIEQTLSDIYEKPGRLTLSVLVRVLFHVALAFEIWFAAWLMGYDISAMEAITLRVVSFGVRSLAFFVWGGLGVQEGAYALLSAFAGLAPGTLIAISLATRVRELVVAMPGVAFWMVGEGLQALKKEK